MRLNVRELARGKWRGILASIGLNDSTLSGKHGPCPICGGKDRFRFDDKEGNGTFFCSHCGSDSGIGLVMRFKDCDFRTAVQLVESAAGFVKSEKYKSAKTDDSKRAALRKLWSETHPVQHGDPVALYLWGRGLKLDSYPAALRTHPSLAYREGDKFYGKYSAMIALVTGPDGSGVTLHRTYLKDGKKASVPSPKKLMPGLPIKGAAIRLFAAGECLGVAEGIETAIAASVMFGIPTWSCVSAGGIESFEPPQNVRNLIVFGDKDESFTGQAAAYALAKRMQQRGITVEIRIPEEGDWADELGKGRQVRNA